MAKKRIVTPGANTTLVEAEQPLRCSRDFLRGIGASQENRPGQLPFRPSQQQKAILGHVGHRLRNDEAPGPDSMAPEFPQGLVNRSALILPVELAQQSPAFGRETILAAHDQDRKSTRLNSSHGSISYAVFCLKK